MGREIDSRGHLLVTHKTEAPVATFQVVEKSGAQGRNRTTDTMIFSHVLYQLSYLGTASRAVIDRPASRSDERL